MSSHAAAQPIEDRKAKRNVVVLGTAGALGGAVPPPPKRVGAGGRPLAEIARQPAFLVFGLVALASFSSGEMLLIGGWDAVNQLVLPVALACLAALFWQLRRQARAA